MKKYFPVILLLAAFTLSACGTPKTDTGTDVNNEKIESKKSLKELLVMGGSQKCTFEVNNNGEVMKGEVIVDGKKFKQTTEISNGEGIMNVYAVSDGVYYYSWSDAMKGNGTKMNIEDIEKNNENLDDQEDTNDTPQQGVAFDNKVDYKCSPSTLTEKDLAIPDDIKFVDYTEMINNLQKMDLNQFQELVP
jgi:predicted small secreted protein